MNVSLPYFPDVFEASSFMAVMVVILPSPPTSALRTSSPRLPSTTSSSSATSREGPSRHISLIVRERRIRRHSSGARRWPGVAQVSRPDPPEFSFSILRANTNVLLRRGLHHRLGMPSLNPQRQQQSLHELNAQG